MKTKIEHLQFYLIITVFSLLITSCFNSENKEIIQVDPEYSKYITAYTSGVISNNSNIIIELKEELSNDEIEKLAGENLFEFDPFVEGIISWDDNKTIRFIPSERFEPMQLYTSTFYLNKVVDVPNDMFDFKFQFQSKYMDMTVYLEGLSSYSDNLKWQKVSGVLTTSDNVSVSDVENLVKAKQNGKELKITWSHNEGSLSHQFIIDSVVRSEIKGLVNVIWDGKLIGVNKDGKINYEIPPLGDFKVIDIVESQIPDQYIQIRFSDPLPSSSNLDGLIYLESKEELSYSINKNVLTIYPKVKLVGEKKLVILNSIKNSLGYEMKKDFSKSINFTSTKPQLKLIGDGVILPSTNGLVFPFKSVNLSAVNVKVIRIFENNISQFFQNNNFDGSRSLTRVGRIIYKDDVKLKSDKNIDLSSWNTFSLDLSDMIETEPGAIYRVMLSFKMSQSLYPCDCDDKSDEEVGIEHEDSKFEVGSSYWYSDKNYNYKGYYRYSESEDPCKLAYYATDRHNVVKNVFASNFGILAKSGNDKEVQIIVTDLRTTNPLEEVEIELYNFQNRLISKAKTNSNGFANFTIDKKPFYLIAKKAKEIGYLKLDEASSLSFSMFDVGGSVTQNGLKGFIYGDRGVWRPGDSIFMSFILEDKQKTLPTNHPVVFTLINTKGQIHHRETLTKSKNGMYVFKTKTNNDDETGNWELSIAVGDAIFSKRLKIETIKPNRLKVKLDFENKILTNKGINPIILRSNWLHGAKAKGLKTNIEMNLSESKTKFNGLDGFNFDDYIKTFKSQDLPLIEKVLDQKGELVFTPLFKVDTDAPGMLRASFKTRVFEKGGDASVDRVLIPYSPYRSYVGFKMPEGSSWSGALYSDEKNMIPIKTVDEFGKSIDRENIKIEIFEISWNWWWQASSKYDVSKYVTGSYKNLVHTDYVNTKNGETIYTLSLKKKLYGRYYIRITDPISKHSSGEVFYLSYKNYWNSNSSKSEGAEMLIFNTNKTKYNVGETVEITLPNAKKGRVLISVETSDKVLESYWFKSSEKNNVFKFKTNSDMSPNIFLTLTFIQPHNQTENDLPIRMYGVKGISVENPSTHLNPVINMNDELQPEEKVSIKISEENGKKMTYTIAVVDEGLLDLTNHKTPNPWNIFYAKQSLGVNTWDMYKYVNGAFSGEIAGLLQLGGDEYTRSENKKKANRFKPVVKFLGPFTIEKNRTSTHTFTMPNYIGSVRTMVIASNEGSYGSTEKTTPVKKPLMVLSTLPRVLGPTEEVILPVTVFAMDKKIKEVTVNVNVNDKFEIIGSTSKKVRFSEIGDQVVNFRLKVKDKLGVGTVDINCSSGREKASHQVELDVRMPNPEITKISSTIIKVDKGWNTSVEAFGISGTNNAILELSNIPPINLEKRLNYLIKYPHGCIEQTTSSVFPQLFLNDLMNLDKSRKKEVQENIKAALLKYKSFQTTSGGFSYWPSYSNYVDEWGTSYAGHFILEAKNKGYKIPIGLIDNWIRYQNVKANEWYLIKNGSIYERRSSQLNQAYRLYTLALSGNPSLSAMNKMRNYGDLTHISRWRLAAAYLIIGRKDVAENLVVGISRSVDEYTGPSFTYGCEVRDNAMILEVLSMLNDIDNGNLVLDKISSELSSENYMSTQTTAYSLLAVSKFISSSNSTKYFTFKLNDKEYKSEDFFYQVNFNNYEKIKDLKLINTSDKLLFASIQNKGIPMYDGVYMNEDNKIDMEVKYYSMDNLPLNPKKIEQGVDFYVETKVKNISNVTIQNLALSQIFPSGWEIRNSRMDLVEESKKSNITYQDIRDDRVYSYFDLKEAESITVKIQLNASYLGKFYSPIVNCEAMYDNSVNAKEGGSWVEVVQGEIE